MCGCNKNKPSEVRKIVKKPKKVGGYTIRLNLNKIKKKG